MKLYGTTTSPFVRRVRVVATELGHAFTLIDTATDAGQAALRAVSPIRKVPIAELDRRVIYDSRAIIAWLTTVHGWGGMHPPGDPWRDGNLVNAIDGALDSAIQLFYLRRDGVDLTGNPFRQRQLDRIAAIFAWLESELAEGGAGFTASGGLGLPELSLLCVLEWMQFRDAYPTEGLTGFDRLRAAHAERPSLVATRPHT